MARAYPIDPGGSAGKGRVKIMITFTPDRSDIISVGAKPITKYFTVDRYSKKADVVDAARNWLTKSLTSKYPGIARDAGITPGEAASGYDISWSRSLGK